jgi:predicted dinucleotide-binding enzyme
MKTIFIFGLGYVGVPLAQALADQGLADSRHHPHTIQACR